MLSVRPSAAPRAPYSREPHVLLWACRGEARTIIVAWMEREVEVDGAWQFMGVNERLVVRVMRFMKIKNAASKRWY